MLAKRIIPCLDVKDGRVVKGVRFVDLRDAGDPVEIARRYDREEADELVFLDITASHEKRDILIDVVRKTAEQVFMPLTVGGGIRTIEDIRSLLLAGADKVSINTAAVADPDFVRRAAERFGSQCTVVAIDARAVPGRAGEWEVYTHGGRRPTGLDAGAWTRRSRPPSSTTGSTPWERRRSISGATACRCGRPRRTGGRGNDGGRTDRAGGVRRPGAGPGRHAGRGGTHG